MIEWEKINRDDCKLVHDIALRYINQVPHDSLLAVTMDLEACHIYCPLILPELLSAKDSDFFHDVCGIIRHLDRETGNLKNNFLPRYARGENELL